MDVNECHRVLERENGAARIARRRLALISAAALALLLAGGCSKSPEEKKAEAAAVEAQTTGRLVAKSNRANAAIEATRVAAVGEAAPAPAKGVVDRPLAALRPGNYVVVARAEGWPDVQAEAKVEAGRITEVTLNFKSGSLRLDSVPVGATVKLAGAVLGKTPLLVPELPAGECLLSIEYPAWPPFPFKTMITENVETTDAVRLPHGKLVVESFPPGATVLFGKLALGPTPLTVERFQAGAKKITLQAKDFPPMEIPFTLEDRGEVTLSPVLANGFPVLDPAALLRAVWVETPPEDPNRLSPAFRAPIDYPSRNGVVKNLNRKKLYETWLEKKFRFAGTVKSYDPEKGLVEFAEQKGDLARYRVLVQLSAAGRADGDLIAQLAKGGTVALHARLRAVEEPEWPAKHISIEFSAAEALHGGLPAGP